MEVEETGYLKINNKKILNANTQNYFKICYKVFKLYRLSTSRTSKLRESEMA